MEVVVEVESPVRKLVTVRFGEDAVARESKGQLARIAKRVKIDGFRPGKVPENVLKQRYAPAARMEAIEQLVRRGIDDSVRREELAKTVFVGRPEISGDPMSGAGLEFKFPAEHMPVVEVTGHVGVAVQRVKVVVSADQVDAQIEAKRREQVAHLPVSDRDVVAADDVVVVTYRGIGEGPVEQIRQEDQTIDLTETTLLQGFAAGLVGAKVGEGTRVSVTLPASFPEPALAGQEVELEVTVSAIQRADLPALDDAFARSVSEFETVAAWRADIEASLSKEASSNEDLAARRRMIDAIVALNPVPVPAGFVHERALEEAERTLNSSRELQQMAQQLKLTPESLAPGMTGRVEASVRQTLVMSAIAEKESIVADEADIEAWLRERAEATRQPLARLRAQFARPGAQADLRARLQGDKVVQWLWDHATIEEVDALPEPAADADAATAEE